MLGSSRESSGSDLRPVCRRGLGDDCAVAPHPPLQVRNGRAEQAIRTLGAADSYGLNPAEYAVTVPSASFDMGDMPSRTAELAKFTAKFGAENGVKFFNDGKSLAEALELHGRAGLGPGQ